MNEFYQDGPKLHNQFTDDRVLQEYVRRMLPQDMRSEVVTDYERLGRRVIDEVLPLGNAAEANPPRHVPYDPWGKRIDQIETSDAWRQLDRISAEEGLVAIGFERKHGALSRIDQFIRLYLFSPSSGVYACPLAMTDGAARALELFADEPLKNRALPRLTTRDPDHFWTSGQWMTERTGGSDVGGTSTVARLENGQYRLYGDKWFTSAVTAQMAMTLARIEGAPAGSRGLSLFYLELHDEEGGLQNIQVLRLKEKLGTRALPTAELRLEGTAAKLVGDAGHGVRKIASLFNITRMYNTCVAVSFMRRNLALARDYARRRTAFGESLSNLPLHVETLANLEVEFEGAFHLCFHLVGLLGKDEVGEASCEESALLRLLTPISKLYTAKQAVSLTSEVLECIGGAGYLEDTGLAVLMRDAQVLPIWEGTTNILSLDMLRAIQRENAFEPFMDDLRSRLESIKADILAGSRDRARDEAENLARYVRQAASRSVAYVQAGARELAFSMARTYTCALLLENAQWALESGRGERATLAANRWCARPLTHLIQPDEAHREGSRLLGFPGER